MSAAGYKFKLIAKNQSFFYTTGKKELKNSIKGIRIGIHLIKKYKCKTYTLKITEHCWKTF